MPIVVPETNFRSTDLPVCAVDLGFSKKKFTTGVNFIHGSEQIIPPRTFVFSKAIAALNEQFANTQHDIVLIVEAPLSIAFSADANPCHRQIELRRNYCARKSPISPKGWFYQAGANLSLASMFFIRGLDVPKDVTVHLIEGFYCNIVKNDTHPADAHVAETLVTHFQDEKRPDLVAPRPENSDGIMQALPGIPALDGKFPPVLLRPELKLKTT